MSKSTKESIKDLSQLQELLSKTNTLKESNMPSINTAVKNKIEPQFSDRFPDPTAPISASEGIDVCLWKFMSDRKTRSLADVGQGLFQYGLDRVEVKDRLVKLANHRNWFVRSGKGASTTYTLRKGIPMPVNNSSETPEVVNPPTGAIVMKNLNDFTFKTTDDLRTPEQSSVKESEPVLFAASATTEKGNPKEPDSLSGKNFHLTQPLCKRDGMHLSIWKVMSDYNEYTAAEIGLLLAEVGFNGKSATVTLSKLYLEFGWFDRIKEGNTYKYTMLKSIPAPQPALNLKEESKPLGPDGGRDFPVIGVKKIDPAATPSLHPEITELKDTAMVKESKEVPKMKSLREDLGRDCEEKTGEHYKQTEDSASELVGTRTNSHGFLGTAAWRPTDSTVASAITPQSYDKLVSSRTVGFSVRIFEMDFSFKEAQDLVLDLVGSGFGPDYAPEPDQKSNLLSVDIKVNGAVVRPAELQEATMQLLAAGFKAA